MIEEENLRRERLAALPPKEDKCFAVFTGIPVSARASTRSVTLRIMVFERETWEAA